MAEQAVFFVTVDRDLIPEERSALDRLDIVVRKGDRDRRRSVAGPVRTRHAGDADPPADGTG